MDCYAACITTECEQLTSGDDENYRGYHLIVTHLNRK